MRAYEPPVLDVLDFLTDLRSAVGAGRAIAVFLLDGSSADHDAWRRKLTALGDARLVCAEVRSPSPGRGPGGSGE